MRQLAVPKRPGPSLWLSLPLLVAGVVLASLSIAFFALAIFRSESNAASFGTPGSEQIALQPGRFDIFSSDATAPLTPSSVTVSPLGGSPLTLGFMGSSQSFLKDGATYQAVLWFVARQAGMYTVNVNMSAGDVAVVPDLTTEAGWNRGWLVGFFLGALIGLAGLVLLIVGLVQRSRAKRAYSHGVGGVYGGYGAWQPPQQGSWQGPGWQYGQGPGGPAVPTQAPPTSPGWSPPPWQPQWPPPPDESTRWSQPGNGRPQEQAPQSGSQPTGWPQSSEGAVPPAPPQEKSSGWPQSSEQPGPPAGGLGP